MHTLIFSEKSSVLAFLTKDQVLQGQGLHIKMVPIIMLRSTKLPEESGSRLAHRRSSTTNLLRFAKTLLEETALMGLVRKHFNFDALEMEICTSIRRPTAYL